MSRAAAAPRTSFPSLHSHHFLLLAMVLGVFLVNWIWIIWDTLPPAWDQGLHLRLTFKYWQVLTSGAERWWFDLLSVEPFYPPFFHLSQVPFLALFGFSADNVIWGNTFYLAVIILATYGIGHRLYDRRTGLLAALLVACYPAPANTSRQFLITTMLIALVTLGYYLFLRSRNFEDKKFSFLFSCVFAAGLMVKWTVFFYLLPAVVIGLWGDSRENSGKRPAQFIFYLGMILATMILPFFIFLLDQGRWLALLMELGLIYLLVRAVPSVRLSPAKIFNLLTLACVSILVCFPWYAHNLANLIKGISKFGFPKIVLKGFMHWDLPIWGFYLEAGALQTGVPLFLLFLAGFTAFLVKRKRFNLLLFVWIAFPVIVFTLLKNKDGRYTMPCLAAMAVITALLITRIQGPRLRKAATGLVVLTSLVTYVYTSLIPGNVQLPVVGGPAFGKKVLPVRERWPIDRILDDILKAAAPAPGEVLTVRTLTNHKYFQRGGFRNAALIRGLPILMKSVKRNLGEMTDFFITKDRARKGESGVRLIKPKKDRLLHDPALRNTFPLFREYPLPDGSVGLVFRRQVSPVQDVEKAENLEEVGSLFLRALEEYPIYGFTEGENMTVTILPTQNREDLLLGRYQRIVLKADSAVTNKLRVRDLELVLENVQINLHDLLLNGKLIFFELGRIQPRLTIRFEDVEAVARKALKGRGEVRLEGRDNRLHVRAEVASPIGPIRAAAVASLRYDPGKEIRPIVESLKIGPVEIPEVFYRRVVPQAIPLRPTPGWPLVTDIRSVVIHPRKLEVNSSTP